MAAIQKLVHVFNSSVVSGPETLVLPSLNTLGFEVHVVFLVETRKEEACQGPIRYAQSLGLKTHTVTVRGRFDRTAIKELSEKFTLTNPACIHAHDVKASTYTLAASRAAGSPRPWKLVSTHHGVRGRSGFKLKLYEAWYVRMILPFFDRVLTVCSSDRALLLRRGLKSDKVITHLNGIDRLKVDVEAKAKFARTIQTRWNLSPHSIPSDCLLLGYVGRLSAEKRLDRILHILAQMRVEKLTETPWRLLVFGTGPLENELKMLCRDLGLSVKVHWMGYRPDVGNELAGLDMLVSMSDAEGLPINILEAGWAGTPVFATAVDGVLDLIKEPNQGMLVDVNASDYDIAVTLASFIDDQTLRSSCSKNLQNVVASDFSQAKWQSELKNIYKSICC